MLTKKQLGESMQTGILSPLFKQKGSREDPAGYRPVTVMDLKYRILTRAIAQRLQEVLGYILGPEQIGFLSKRLIGENIDLLTETARYLDQDAPDKGGIIVMLDNMKAFDRLQWDFLQDALKAFGFPEEFRSVVHTLYKDAKTAVKVNGYISEPFSISSGVRQGCALSALLYIIVQEIHLRMIRNDTRLQGISIPGRDGGTATGEEETIKERCLADDLAVYLRKASLYPTLREVNEKFERISCHRTNYTKSFVLLAGAERERLQYLNTGHPLDPRLIDDKIQWTTIETFNDKYHGVRPSTPEGIEEQWNSIKRELIGHISKAETRQNRDCMNGRVTYIKQNILPGAYYPCRYQAPPRQAQEKILKEIQKKANDSVLGAVPRIAVRNAVQSKGDMGINHPHLESQMAAEHAMRILRLIQDPTHRPYKNFIRYQMKNHYGAVNATDALITSNYSFARLIDAPANSITDVMRAGFRALGTLPEMVYSPPPLTKEEASTAKGEKKKRKGIKGRLDDAEEANRETRKMRGKAITILYTASRIDTQPESGGVHADAKPRNGMTTTKDAISVKERKHVVITSRDPHVAARWSTREGFQRTVYAVDAELIIDAVIDVSDKHGLARNSQDPSTREAKNAMKEKRVIIRSKGEEKGHIPWQAITDTMDTSGIPQGEKDNPTRWPTAMQDGLLELSKRAEERRLRRRKGAGYQDDLQPAERIKRKTWSRDDITETILVHGIHASQGGTLSGRSTRESEDLAVKWATAGYRKVNDLVHRSGIRYKSWEEVMDEPVSQGLLREEYEQIKGALPEDWEGLLKKVNSSGHREGSWITTTDGKYHKVQEQGWWGVKVQSYTMDQKTAELTWAGERTIPRADRVKRCQVRETQLKYPEHTIAHERDGGPQELRCALKSRTIYHVTEETGHTHHLDIQTTAVGRPVTLHKREPTRIQDLTVSQISQIKRAQMFRIPTAFDRYHPSQHWAAEYEGYGPEEYRDRIANLASSIHTEGIPSQMKDNILLTCVCSSLLYEIKTDTLLTNHSNKGAGTHAVNYSTSRAGGWHGQTRTVKSGS